MISTLASHREWAKVMPAAFGRYASRYRWRTASHLMLLNKALIEVASRRIQRLIVEMPPRHGKSTLTSGYFPAWYLGNFPEHEIILGSYELTYAATWGGMVRDLISEFGPSMFGVDVSSARRRSDDWRIVRDGESLGGMRSAGIGSGITGRGADLLIMDDPIKDAEQANSTTYRDRAWNWYQSTFYSRRNTDDVPIILIMTRWHEDDLGGRILRSAAESGESWHRIRLPGLAEENDILGRSVGDALWPEKWDRKALQNIRKTIGSYWFSALYQQSPAPSEGNIFKRKWWRFWKPLHSDLGPVRVRVSDDEWMDAVVVELPRRLDKTIQSWDLTFDSASSMVVGEAWARHGANAYLLHEDRAAYSFTEQIDAIRRMTSAFPNAATKLIEKKANAAAAIDTLQGSISGLTPVEPRGDKKFRANATTPHYESGNVYLPHPALAPWVWEYMEEHNVFDHGEHDDRVDAASQALMYLLGGGVSDGDPAQWASSRR